MPDNAFIGKPEPPNDSELVEVLGSTKRLWDRLVVHLAREHDVTEQEWKAYSRESGWTLRLKRKDRTIVYLSPYRGTFLAAFALGDRAVAAARESGLPERVMKIIAAARRYAEGTAVRIEVRQAKCDGGRGAGGDQAGPLITYSSPWQNRPPQAEATADDGIRRIAHPSRPRRVALAA